MVNEAVAVEEKPKAEPLEAIRPDFSSFSIQPISWTLFMSNDIEREDSMSLVFPGLPLYNDKKIGRRQLIEIPIQGLGTTKAFVRERLWESTSGQSRTTLLLGTGKFKLDTAVEESKGEDEESLGMEEAVKFMLEKAQIGFQADVDIGTNREFPNGVSLELDKSILDYMKVKFSNNGKLILDYWFDIFGTFHVHERDGIQGKPESLDFAETPGILSISSRLYDSWTEQEVIKAPELNDPAGEKQDGEPGIEMSWDPGTNDISYDNVVIPGNTATVSGDKPATYTKNVPSKNLSLSLSMGGLHYDKVHKRYTIENLPMSDIRDVVLSTVTLSEQDGVTSTTMSFDRQAAVGGSLTKEPVQQDSETEGEPEVELDTKIVDGELQISQPRIVTP